MALDKIGVYLQHETMDDDPGGSMPASLSLWMSRLEHPRA